MFVPLDQAAWPEAGEVRDLRISLNAPVLLAPGQGARPTRAALGWLPRSGDRAAVRLWLRGEDASGPVRAFELRAPGGSAESPAARATALEGAERFLGGLGFLFPESAEPVASAGSPPRGSAAPTAPGLASPAPGASNLRASDPGPDSRLGAARAADATTAVRADVRLTKFRRRGPTRVPDPAGGSTR